MKNIPLLKSVLVISLALSAHVTAQAQTADASSNSTSDSSSETITLSPFNVNADQDYGYMAANTLSGGRLATELQKTPVSTQVLTRELLDDLGITDVQSALAWSTGGMAASDSDVNPNAASGDSLNGRPLVGGNDNSISLRGFSAVSVARNYFSWSVNSDGYNTERIDISRGPNALIFGDASTGGIVNVTTKRAGGAPKRSIDVRYSDQGQRRATVDFNQRINSTLALRVNALMERSDGWRDFYQNDRDGLFATTTITPWKGAQIRLEGEYGDIARVSPSLYLRDVASRWDGSTVYSSRLNGSFNPSSATGTARFDNTSALRNRPYLILDLGDQSAGFVDWQGWARTTGRGTPLETGLPEVAAGLAAIPINENAALGEQGYRTVPDYQYAVRASAYRLTDEYHVISGFFEQQFGDNLFLEIAGNRQVRDNTIYTPASHNQLYVDVNENQPDGSVNPNFLRPYVSGTGYRPIATAQTHDEVRASLVYLLDAGFTKQRIGLVLGHRMIETEQHHRWYLRTNGTNPNVADVSNRLYFKAYLDEEGRQGAITSSVGDVVNYADGTVAEYVASTLGSNTLAESSLSTVQAFMNGSWFKGDRLHTILGVRADRVNTDSYSPEFDATTGIFTNFVYDETTKKTVNAPSMGAVLDVTSWFSPYINYSKTFSAPAGGTGAYDIFLDLLPVRRGEGWDIGFKFNAWAGRVVGSVGYYQTEQQNTSISDSALADRINAINALLGGTEDLAQRAYRDTQDTRSTGVEMDLTANLTKSWSLMMNLSLPESEVSNSLPRYTALVEQNRSTWEAAANDASNPGAQDIRDYLSEIDGRFKLQADGLPITGTTDLTAKLFTRYRVADGSLKGLFFGGGVSKQGKILRGEVAGENVYSDGYETYTALVGYGRKINDVHWKFQVNISNLFDSEQFQYTAYDANDVPRQFRRATPRAISMTLSANF